MTNDNDKKKALKAYEIVFSYEITQPGSITVPGYDEDDAKARMMKYFNTADFRNLSVSEVVDVTSSEAFKQMVAYHALSHEKEKEYFEKWMAQAEAASAVDIVDAEVIEVKTIN